MGELYDESIRTCLEVIGDDLPEPTVEGMSIASTYVKSRSRFPARREVA